MLRRQAFLRCPWLPLPCPWRCWFDPPKATPMSDIADSSNMIPTSDYREHAPVAALDRHVACVWTQRIGPGSTPMVQRIVPDGCVDIVWLDGRLHVAGPDTGPVLAPLNPGSLVVGVRFRPGLAPTMLGLPASELIDDRVDLDVLWGRAAGRLAGRPSGAPGRQPRSSPSSPPRSAPASASSTVAASTPSVTDRRRSIGCSASSGSSRWPGRRRRSATWDWPAWPPTPATPTRRTWPGSAASSAVFRHGGCSADGHRQPRAFGASFRRSGKDYSAGRARWRLGRAVAFLTYERQRFYVSLADRGLEAFVGFGSIFPHTGPIWRNHHMCRLLAYSSMAPTTPQELVGDDLKSFVSLAEEHGDGWGMAWYEEDGELNVAKDVEAAHASDLLDKLSRTTETQAMVLHLRRASPGLSIALENTHPFTGGRLAFAHNGWIRPIPELEGLLDPEVRHGLRGTTDSERYFQLLLAAMEESGDVERALPPLLERLRGEFRYNALNFVLLTEQHLYAVCDYSVEAVIRRGDPEYYTLGYRGSSGSVLVGSSGCWGDRLAWQTLVNHQALVVDRASLQTTVLDLA